jgi:acetylornithine deacetylase/succinyl-diaminopimelate desuccinylase-like protein
VDDAARAIHKDLESERRLGTPGVESEEISRPVFTDEGGTRRATIRMERRLSPTEEVADVVRRLEHETSLVTESAGSVAVEVMVRTEPQMLYNGQTTMVRHVTHAWAVDPYDPLMVRARQSLAAAGCEVRTGKWQLGRLGMGTAGGTLTTEFSVRTIGYGPGEEIQAHAANESVATENIVKAAYGTAAIVHGLVGIPVCGWTSDEI